MKARNLKAAVDAVDFVRDNPRGFEALRGWDVENVWQIVEGLVNEGVPFIVLVQRIIYCSVGELILDRLYARYESDKRAIADMARGLVELPLDMWLEWCGPAWRTSAVKIVSAVEDFVSFFNRYRQILLNPAHPLYDLISADAYWQKRVSLYIVKGDYGRAWEELKKASRGFIVGEYKAEDVLRHPEFVNYQFGASKTVIEKLVKDLYSVMRNKNLVADVWAHLVDGKFQLPHREVSTAVFETKMPSAHRGPRSYEHMTERAGLKLALRFFLISEGRGCFNNRIPDVFTIEGAMVLNIADWYRQRQNSRRRSKYEKLVAEMSPSGKL